MSKFNQVVRMLLVLLGVVSLYAQESASIVGTVTDSSGAPMAGVTVAIRNTSTNATVNAQTAADGNFSFASFAARRLFGFGRSSGLRQDDPKS